MLPHLRRILFPTAAAISAFLLLAILILWPLSYFRADALFHRTANGDGCIIDFSAGRVGVAVGYVADQPYGLSYWDSRRSFAGEWNSWSYTDHSSINANFTTARLLGCEYQVALPGGVCYPLYCITIPYSYLALLSAITPTLWLVAIHRRRRRAYRLAYNLCPTCAYDLRGHANIPNPRCPECGTPIATTRS